VDQVEAESLRGDVDKPWPGSAAQSHKQEYDRNGEELVAKSQRVGGVEDIQALQKVDLPARCDSG